MSGLELSKEVDADFKELFEMVKQSPEYSLTMDYLPMSEEIEGRFEEMVWQGYLAGLKASRRFDPVYEIRCSTPCGCGITETGDGEIIEHRLALEEGWSYDFDKEIYYCPDCQEPTDES